MNLSIHACFLPRTGADAAPGFRHDTENRAAPYRVR